MPASCSFPGKTTMKRLLSHFCLSLGLVFCLSGAVQADEKSHRQAAEDLMAATQADQMINAVYAQVDGSFANMVRQMKLSPEQMAIAEKHMKRSTQVMREEITWAKLKPEITAAYVSVFTEDELKQLIAFYNSPIGKKMVEKMPELMRASMQISQAHMQKILPRIQVISQEMVQELKAQQEKKPAAPADKKAKPAK
jgi:uncharacterized protein